VSGPTPVAGVPAGRRYTRQLARRLKVAGNLTLTLAVIGPAASVFAIGSLALRQQGSGAFLAFLIAALISGCLTVAWAELGVLYPTAGGLYGIVARVLGRRAGFLALVLQLALFVIVPSAFALAASQYLTAVWCWRPGSSRHYPWPGCEPEATWPSSGSPTCSSPAKRP
jgi:amino acid transporter